MCVCVYIYIYIYREREIYVVNCIYIYIYTYIYIYIYIEVGSAARRVSPPFRLCRFCLAPRGGDGDLITRPPTITSTKHIDCHEKKTNLGYGLKY